MLDSRFWRRSFAVLAAVCLLPSGVAGLAAGEAPAPPPTPAPPAPAPAKGEFSLPEIDWWAVKMSFLPEKSAVVLSGSAWVRYKSLKLEADHIVFFRETREVYAEGNIRLREGESEIAAQVAYVDMLNDRGYMVDATVRVSRPAAHAPGTSGKMPSRQDMSRSFEHAVEGKAALMSARDPYGVYLDVVDDPQARLNFVFNAEKIVRESRYHYYADKALLTTDDMVDPLYGVKVSRLDFYMYDAAVPDRPGQTELRPKMIQAKGARPKLGPVSLFPLPTITYDLTRHMPYITADYGKSNRWGPYSLLRVGWGLGANEQRFFDPTRIYFDVDNRMGRGPALGAELRYKTGVRSAESESRGLFERGEGHIRGYTLWEMFDPDSNFLESVGSKANSRESWALFNRDRRQLSKLDGTPRRQYDANLLFAARRARDGAGAPSMRLDTYKDDVRYLVDFQHHQPLRHVGPLNDVMLDFKYQRQSDRDFVYDYFHSNYQAESQPEALASVRKAGDNYWSEILYRASPQDFESAAARDPLARGVFTGYEPALTYSLAPFALPKGAYVSGEFQAAHLTREFDPAYINQKDFEANRIYLKGQLERPFHWAGLDFRPYLGGQAALYDKSRDGGSTTQSALEYGLDIHKRLYGVFPELKNAELGIDGFRHIIEPYIEYAAIGDTPQDPVDILDFDAIDDLRGVHRIRLGLDQIFQTGKYGKDDVFSYANVAGLNLHWDIYPRQRDRERLLDGAWTDLLYARGFFNVTQALQLNGTVGYSFADSRVEVATVGLTLDPGGRWRLSVGERFNFQDKDRGIVGSDLTYINLEWQLSERWGFSFQQSNQRVESLLERKGIQTRSISVTRSYGPIIAKFTTSVDNTWKDKGIHFSLAPAFTYRNLVVPTHDLLVESGEVGEAEEHPEERNFDPFSLTKKKSGKKKPAGTGAPPPPEKAPGSPASPAPPEGSPAPKTGARPADTVPLDGPTATPPPKPKAKAPVDQDDWSAYPATSARE